MAKKNSTKTATKEALQASEPRIQTFSQWGGMYIKESPYGWTTDYEFERQGHVQNQTDLKPNFLMIQDNVISTSTKSLETRNETQLVSTAPYDDEDGTIVQRQFTGVTCLAGNYLYAAFDDGSIRYINLDDAPNTEQENPELTKWHRLTIIDADSDEPSETSFNWSSINYFQSQLVCFNKNTNGVGEIFSGVETSPFIVNVISSTQFIPDPNTSAQKPIIQTINMGNKSKYSPSKLYLSPYPRLAVHTLGWNHSFGDVVQYQIAGYANIYQHGDNVDRCKFYHDINCTQPFTVEEVKQLLPIDELAPRSCLALDITTEKCYRPLVTQNDPDGIALWVGPETVTQIVDLPHRIQIAYTYSNKFGQTLESQWATFYSNLNPLVWNSETGGAVISQVTPAIDYNITGVDIYYTKDDSLDMNFLGHIEKNTNSATGINTLGPNEKWEYTWYGAYADISEWTNVSLTVPTENTTKGVDAAYMNVHDGRCYFFGGSLPYRLYIGGRVGHELCVATGVGGAYVDIEPGSGMVINNTHKFKTYNGANIVTIMCGHPNTHQVRRFNLIQTNVTLTNELSATGFMTEEVSNVVGALSHHGSGVWAQGLYTLSRYGLALTTQQMENSNNLRAQLVSDAIQPIFTESLSSTLNNTQMIFVDDIVYFALSKGPQYLNCGLIGKAYNENENYYRRDEYLRLGQATQDIETGEITLSAALDHFATTTEIDGFLGAGNVYNYTGSVAPEVILNDFNVQDPSRLPYIPNPSVGYDGRDDASLLSWRNRSAVKNQFENDGFFFASAVCIIHVTHRRSPGESDTQLSLKAFSAYVKVSSCTSFFNGEITITDPAALAQMENIAYSFMPSDWSGTPSEWLVSVEYDISWAVRPRYDRLFPLLVSPLLYYKENEEWINAQNEELQLNKTYYRLKDRSLQFNEPEEDITPELYYSDIYHYYIQEAVLDDIIFAYDVNSQAWYTFTYQPNLLPSSIDDFGPDTPQDTEDPELDPPYSTAIKSLINFDSQSSPEGIGIVTTDRIDMIPTAGVVDNAPTFIYDTESAEAEIAVPNFVAHIETGELSTASPPQQFHTLSQLEFRFDYFFGDLDIDIEGVDYYGRTFHIHKDVTYDEIQQDLAVYVRVDYIVNTYNIKIKGRAHFRLTHVMAKIYPESRKINLVYGFDDSSLYKKRHGGTQFTHHYIKDYNNLRRALEP